MKTLKVLFSAAAIFSLACASAGAQSAPADDQQGQAAQQPQQLVANETQHVGDWLVRCFPVKSPAPCDMFYVLAIKKTGQMLLSVRFAYAPAQDKNLFQIGVPLMVSFAKGLVISTDAGSSAPLPFIHCDRVGCFVESVLDDATMDTLANAPGGAKIRFSFYNGKDAVLPFPVNGFLKARDAMVQLAKSRVSAPAKPAH